MPHLELNPLREDIPVPEDELLWALGHQLEPGQRDDDQSLYEKHVAEFRNDTKNQPSISISRKE